MSIASHVTDATPATPATKSPPLDLATAEGRTARLAAIVSSSDDAIVGKSLDGTILTWNRGAELVYGYTAEEIIGQPLSRLLHADRLEEMFEIMRTIREGGRVAAHETQKVRKDGKVIGVSLTMSPILDPSGRLLGVSSIVRDVTEQKVASQYARSLIEASLDPLVTISPGGKITDVNEATIKITGVPRDRLIGTDFSDYFTEPEKAREGYLQVFSKGFVTDYPLTIHHRDQRLTNVLYNASVYKDVSGNVLGVFAAARDITAQKLAEAEVAHQRTKGLDRIAELERFQKLTVGRELKMIELKKEVQELKSQLSRRPGPA